MGWQMQGDSKPITPLDGTMEFTHLSDIGLVCLPCLETFNTPDWEERVTGHSDVVLVSCDNCGASNVMVSA